MQNAQIEHLQQLYMTDERTDVKIASFLKGQISALYNAVYLFGTKMVL